MKNIVSICCLLLLISGCAHRTHSPAPDTRSIPQSPLITSVDAVLPTAPRNFTEAKKVAWKIYAKHPVSFYCQCAFTAAGEVQPATCLYSPTKITNRTYRIEWEHIVPAKLLGANRACWKTKICTRQDGEHYKGRACCTQVDETFQAMEANLHNLVPAIGTINQSRGVLSFGEVKGKTENFMGCPIKINRAEKKVEPSSAIKGLIARAYLYMSQKYNLLLPAAEKALYQKWHHQYPPDAWEIEWNELVKSVQGDGNPYIRH